MSGHEYYVFRTTLECHVPDRSRGASHQGSRIHRMRPPNAATRVACTWPSPTRIKHVGRIARILSPRPGDVTVESLRSSVVLPGHHVSHTTREAACRQESGQFHGGKSALRPTESLCVPVPITYTSGLLNRARKCDWGAIPHPWRRCIKCVLQAVMWIQNGPVHCERAGPLSRGPTVRVRKRSRDYRASLPARAVVVAGDPVPGVIDGVTREWTSGVRRRCPQKRMISEVPMPIQRHPSASAATMSPARVS